MGGYLWFIDLAKIGLANVQSGSDTKVMRPVSQDINFPVNDHCAH